MEHALVYQLKLVARLYAEAEGTTLAIVAKRALNDNTFFTRVDAGSSFTLRTYDRFLLWLSDNWPADVEWPHDVPRPASTEAA